MSPNQMEALLEKPVLPLPPGVTSNFDGATSTPPYIFPFFVSAAVVSSAAVALHVFTRLYIQKEMSCDDYASMAGWLVYAVYLTLHYWIAMKVVNKHLWDISWRQFIDILRVGFIADKLYWPIVVLINLSVLLQYLRIFQQSRSRDPFLFWGSVCLMVGSILFAITGTCLCIFDCLPVERAWNPIVSKHCMDFRTVITILTAFRVFTEVGTLILPLPVIWRLHIRTGKKFAISALFGLGLLTCLASIINAGYYLAWEPVAKTDPSILIGESTVLMGVLQHAEILLGLICACSPTLPKYFKYISPAFFLGGSHSCHPLREGGFLADGTRRCYQAMLYQSSDVSFFSFGKSQYNSTLEQKIDMSFPLEPSNHNIILRKTNTV